MKLQGTRRTSAGSVLVCCINLEVVLSVGSGIAVLASVLCALILQGHLEHANLPLQLVVNLLGMAALPFKFRNLGLHLGAFNVPGVPSALMVVPFDLEEAHDA